MLFHVAGIVFGFVPGVSFLYNPCLLHSGHPEAAGPQCHCSLQRPLLFFLGFLPFITKNTFSVNLRHLSLAELAQLALGRFGSQKYKPASSQ